MMNSITVYDIHILETPIGKMIATANQEAIVSLSFIDKTLKVASKNPLLIRLEKELQEYFQNKRIAFTLPLNPAGTIFQKNVWDTLLTIPYGATLSYANEAKRLGNPKAIRAVANANGKNPIAILIPCHRVISTDGSLGGYNGGIEKKEFLLALEKQ